MYLLDTDHVVVLQTEATGDFQRLMGLSRNMTVLTRNLLDFNQVPGLAAEDWTAKSQSGAR